MAMFISEKGKMLFQKFQAIERLAFELRYEARDLQFNPANDDEEHYARNIKRIGGEVLKVLINSGY